MAVSSAAGASPGVLRGRWHGPSPLARWEPDRHRWVVAVVLALVCGVFCFYGLWVGELYRTEALRAIIGREMLRSGDWLVPRLYGEPLLTKPPGMYAAIALASWPWGEVTETTARLPSAVAAAALVLLVYWTFRRCLERRSGLIAAAIAPCSWLWLDKGIAAEIDMLQVFWVGASLLFLLRAVEAEEEAPRTGSVPPAWLWWVLALVCVAGGLLTKWTAPAFFYAAAVPLLAWRRRLHLLWSWRHLLAAALAAGLCLAWAAWVVHQVGWDVFYATVRNEALPRLSHRHHLGSAWEQVAETLLHPGKILLAHLPWSVFALATFRPGFGQHWDEHGRRLLQALHCWAWPNLLLWTLLPDHATRHSFPLFPGISGLAALAWAAHLDARGSDRGAAWFAGSAALALALFALGAPIAAVAGLALLPSDAWGLVLVLAVLALGVAAWGLRGFWNRQPAVVLVSIILTWVVVKLAFVHCYVPLRNHGRQPREKAAVLAEHVPPHQTLYVFLLKDEGIMFYYGRPVVRLRGWNELPRDAGQVWCILQQQEYEALPQHRQWTLRHSVALRDEQGDPIVLVGLERTAAGSGPPPREAQRSGR